MNVDYSRWFGIAMIFVAIAAIPVALIYFTVKMTHRTRSWVKLVVDFLVSGIVLGIFLGPMKLEYAVLPLALAFAIVRHVRRPKTGEEGASDSEARLDVNPVTASMASNDRADAPQAHD